MLSTVCMWLYCNIMILYVFMFFYYLFISMYTRVLIVKVGFVNMY